MTQGGKVALMFFFFAVCATAAALLRETGSRRVGLYTSPHLVHLRERARIDGLPAGEAAWLAGLAPTFRRYGAEPPAALRPIYRSFNEDDAMVEALAA